MALQSNERKNDNTELYAFYVLIGNMSQNKHSKIDWRRSHPWPVINKWYLQWQKSWGRIFLLAGALTFSSPLSKTWCRPWV